ncbi:MAG: hypothetical protein QXO94_07735, partial [Candidatus Bathyarchaeia archaeon]
GFEPTITGSGGQCLFHTWPRALGKDPNYAFLPSARHSFRNQALRQQKIILQDYLSLFQAIFIDLRLKLRVKGSSRFNFKASPECLFG